MSCDRKGSICAHYGFCADEQLSLPPGERLIATPDETLKTIAENCMVQQQSTKDNNPTYRNGK